MAAVAAEPGAAAVPTTSATADDEGRPELGPGGTGHLGAAAEPDNPAAELFVPRMEDGADGESRHVRPELETTAGKALPESDLPLDRVSLDRFSPGLPGDPDGGGTYRSILPDTQPYAVFLHSFPDPPPVTEAGLSLAEPAEPTTNVTTNRAETMDRDRAYTALIQAELRPGPGEDGTADRLSVRAGLDPDTGYCKISGGAEEKAGRGLQEESSRTEPVLDLNPGSEVRVFLDHVIDDALVVSFRRGEKVFSGVLMDISKRFGPYGIPITVFPRRDNQTGPPTSLQLVAGGDDPSIKQEETTATSLSPPPQSPHSWTSKLPPLFQEGAPYPPPLLIRDTYNQALPQPPPRKIKRPKRRYRCEEPTSIMNAIKLRPRQVLCDKCKGVVASGGYREARRGAVDLRSEEASRRRRAPEGPISSELKRLRNDDKPARPAADRRSSSGIRVSSTAPPSSRSVLRGRASSSSSSSSSGRVRLKLNSKKVQNKSSAFERSKARQVLNKLATQPPQDQNQDQNQNQDCPKAMTRAAALQNHNQKVHFTRRLQRLSGAAISGHTGLPARIRLKPQRYRTDEAPHSSSSSSPTKHSVRLAPPTLPPSPTPLVTAPPTSAICVAVETQKTHTPEEEGAEQREAPSSASSSSDSSHSECSSTETFDPPHPEDPPPSVPAPSSPPSSSSLAPPCPPSSPSVLLRTSGEDEEDGGELKRRRKSSTSSFSSSSSSSSVFSKSVSKVPLPDGRIVCVGDIVWAKIYGFPWWPARVLGITVARRGDTGLAVRQEARVSWFGSPTTSFLPLTQLSPFLETFQLRFDRKRKGPYRRAIAEAASAAKQLTPEVRALLTQFET
ncbi:PWWP domain-containing protein 2A [Melanotaenia boesemani]|uniref:PWWP domain-containing protein 2A n=1 Tax=Melanotaenia boesemani TaxID=1250792 RepID=UPI001C0557E3|nr:PWWP domain-containing protein 2A [Melanotaenia boesemani]